MNPQAEALHRCDTTLSPQPAGRHSCAAASAASPVGDETGVDVAVLALVALLSDGHLADGSPQPGQEQAGDEQVGHHDGGALQQENTRGEVLHAQYGPGQPAVMRGST